ncbi:MAG: LytTR family DNA-binding domain-containing protein [Clostridia bacterium]
MKIIIFDKDLENANTLYNFITSFCRSFHFRIEAKVFTNEQELLNYKQIHKEQDVFFLRIESAEEFSLADAIRKLDERNLLVFVSNNHQLVFLSFLLHPYSFIRLNYYKEEIPRILLDIKKYANGKNSIFIVYDKGKSVEIDLHNVMYAEVIKNNVYLFLKDKSVVKIKQTISQSEEMWSDLGFARVHMSYLVNCRFVKSYTHKDVTLRDGMEIPISRSRYQEFVQHYEEFIISNKM